MASGPHILAARIRSHGGTIVRMSRARRSSSPRGETAPKKAETSPYPPSQWQSPNRKQAPSRFTPVPEVREQAHCISVIRGGDELLGDGKHYTLS